MAFASRAPSHLCLSVSICGFLNVFLFRHLFDRKRNARFMLSVRRNFNGVKSRRFKFQLLNIQNEIARDKSRVARQNDFHRNIHAGHDRRAVFIYEIDFQRVIALLHFCVGNAERHGTLRMRGGKLLGENRVERAENIQLAVVIGRGIAQNCQLNRHWKGM